MFELLKALSKKIQPLILNLKPVQYVSLKEGGDDEIGQTTAPLFDHELLIELIQSIEPYQIRRIYSLDYTINNPKIVYGQRIEQHTATIDSFTKMLQTDITIAREQVLKARVEYSDNLFFTTFDNWRVDRYESMAQIKESLTKFALAYERVFAQPQKNMTQRHNLGVLSLVIQDSLDFVKGIKYDR